MADLSLDEYITRKNPNPGNDIKMRVGSNFNNQGQGRSNVNFSVVGLGKVNNFDARQKLSQKPIQDARQKLSQKPRPFAGRAPMVRSAPNNIRGPIMRPQNNFPGPRARLPVQRTGRLQIQAPNPTAHQQQFQRKRPATGTGPSPPKTANLSSEDVRIKIQNAKAKKMDAREMIQARRKAKNALKMAKPPENFQPTNAPRITITGLSGENGSNQTMGFRSGLQTTIPTDQFPEQVDMTQPLTKTIQNSANRVGNNILITPTEVEFQRPSMAPQAATQHHMTQQQYHGGAGQYGSQSVYNSPQPTQYSQPAYNQNQTQFNQNQYQVRNNVQPQGIAPAAAAPAPAFHLSAQEPLPTIRFQNDDYRPPDPAPRPAPPPAHTQPAVAPPLRLAGFTTSKGYDTEEESVPSVAKSILQGRLGAAADEPSSADSMSLLQGYRVSITNLHTVVTQDDIVELFGAVGGLKKARLMRAGTAEVIFIRKQDAVAAVKKYHNRELDGQPMQVVLTTTDNPVVEKTPTLDAQPLQSSKPLGEESKDVTVDMALLYKAFFKTTSKDDPPSRPVTFTVKI